uniref:NADH dehydrogenase subunit 6 n=1 Tax=Olinga feredayi TaxID=177813 RepID=UPI0028D38196|nr:NADH dehydrogenase subunit 6 [Olinga feredayi]WMQ76538.1 NADH dehydrogenase subunit 6 [Olinga feredayi]
MFFMFNYLMVFFSSFLLQINQPMMMTIMLIILALMISLMIGLMNSSFWFSYVMFLIFVGGLFILFIYVSSMASNKFYQLKMNNLIIWMIILLITLIIMLILMKSYSLYLIKTMEVKSFWSNFFWFNNEMENNNKLSKIYNKHSSMISLMLMNYLLMALFVCVKITKISQGPLRKSN